MTLPTQTPNQLVDGQIASFAAATGVSPVFTSGDVLLALFQTVSIQIDFLQALIVEVVNLTRAQTSTGADLDSWMAQFGFIRLPATYAEGPVTFSKNQPAVSPINIAAATLIGGTYLGGTVIQSPNGGTQFQVIPDTDEPTYDATLNAYVLAIGQTSLTAVVQALTPGSSSNVAANSLVQIGGPLPGIDTVTNPAPITNGIDAESDNDFRARFILFLATLAKATLTAILAAAHSVQQGLQISPFEYQDPAGNPLPGAFTLFVDDGSGDPPSQLITEVYAAVDAVRAFGIRPFVAAPNVTTAVIVITIKVAAGFSSPTVEAAVQNAIAVQVNQLAADATLYVSTAEGAALRTAGVVSVQPGTTLNGANADLTPASTHELRTDVGSITVSTY